MVVDGGDNIALSCVCDTLKEYFIAHLFHFPLSLVMVEKLYT